MDTPILSVPFERIVSRIFVIRGKKVMFDYDLAEMYEVSTKRLNEQVKRNLSRFPSDFMFQLNDVEKLKVVANCDHLQLSSEEDEARNRSQFATGSQKHRDSKHLPYVFTEQGVAMLSSVLKSPKAIETNIQIIRTFTKLREIMSKNEQLAERLDKLEEKYGKNIADIFSILRHLVTEKEKPRRPIGFSRQ